VFCPPIRPIIPCTYRKPKTAATLRDSSGAMADQIVRWLKHATEMAERVKRLRKVRDVVAVPGACDRAASFLLASVQKTDAARTAA
jgi:lipid-A-disaccharide synthase